MDSLNLKFKKYWLEEAPHDYNIVSYIKSYVRANPDCEKKKAHEDFSADLDLLLSFLDDGNAKDGIIDCQKQLKHANNNKKLNEFWS
ncbi:hypothetical protein A0J61_11538, partial [Choanephora cucurbitarum]